MATKYLNLTGLTYFWGRIKTLLGGKADKVSSATNGNFAGLDANGNLTDSGKKASDFATSGHNHDSAYKPKQTAVSDPTTSGTSVEFIATLSQNANGVVTPTKKTVSTVTASSGGTGGNAGLMTAAQAEKLAGIVGSSFNISKAYFSTSSLTWNTSVVGRTYKYVEYNGSAESVNVTPTLANAYDHYLLFYNKASFDIYITFGTITIVPASGSNVSATYVKKPSTISVGAGKCIEISIMPWIDIYVGYAFITCSGELG